jgi:outer membrane cobalamin receptor
MCLSSSLFHLRIYIVALLSMGGLQLAAEVTEPESIETLVVEGQETANNESATSFSTPISNLAFNPRVDLQARNIEEAQADLTIRGGIFENTGFRVGGINLFDPHTGHYATEIPISPKMLTVPEVLVGSSNALLGFNSTIGTLDYDWHVIENGGQLSLAAGNYGFNRQSLYQGWSNLHSFSERWVLNAELESARSESDGTIRSGDHDFDRSSARLQLLGPQSQTDFFAGYQAKFFGWPGMYTANENNLETEALKTKLIYASHRQNYGEGSDFRFTSYLREHSDYYVYWRHSPHVYNAAHKSKVFSTAFSGKHSFNDQFSLDHATQLLADSIDSTTLNRTFTDRAYIKFSLLPAYRVEQGQQQSLTYRAGFSWDDNSQNKGQFSPLADVTWQKTYDNGDLDQWHLAFAQSSQVAGYGAIAGPTGGLFASNPELDRELSNNLELGAKLQRADWMASIALFYRWDQDLVDWTYDSGTPSSRSANNVDINTLGLECLVSKQWDSLKVLASYALLEKSEDYGLATVDASFYALNYAEHRGTLGLIWSPLDTFQLRVDNEWRHQAVNAIRSGSDSVFFTHLSLSIYPSQVPEVELFVAVDNLWETEFEEIPGTVGKGRQFSAGLNYFW